MSQGCSCNPFPSTPKLRKITPITAFMSTVWGPGTDGNNCIDGKVSEPCCATKNTDSFPWIALQLSYKDPVSVKHVVVINRASVGRRLRNLEVRVANVQPLIGDKKFTEGRKIGNTFTGPGTDNQVIDFFASTNEVRGKFVVLQMASREFLNLAEVIVYGY